LSRISRSPSFVATLSGLIAAAALVAGCGLFSNPPAPTATGPAATPTFGPGPTATPRSATPAPTNPVGTIVLISAVGEAEDGTPSALAWQGVQDAAGQLGASPKLVTPTSMAEVTAGVKKAADEGTTVVVTVGPEAAQAILDNAGDHAATQFFELDQAIRDGAPSNVHGIVFDEAEAGYLAGFVAASVSQTDTIGMVGFTTTDVRTANYVNGFKNGATDANPAVATKVAYANRSKDPQAGRAATDSLVKGKADVVLAMSDFTGAGAMREACAQKVTVVALDTDASLALPDVEPCLLVTVLKRYDVAVRDAILRYAAMDPLPAPIMADVASGGISLSGFHKPMPTGFDGRLAGLLAAMRNGPPRPTPTPAPTPKAAPTT
jgi:basic membrane protein A